MRIYFSGIGGTGIGPLAEIAHQAGYEVCGSDIAESPMTIQLRDLGVDIYIGQDGSQISQANEKKPIDWVVYTAAIDHTHPEIKFAIKSQIKISKRDELLATIIKEHELKLIAVAGTHGKTSTTAMLIWLFESLGMPISYSVGSTLQSGRSGQFDDASDLFIYECDEYDRNFLAFSPYISLLPSVDYDHPNIYKTVEDYVMAFRKFISQSQKTVMYSHTAMYLGLKDSSYIEPTDIKGITLPGEHVRSNARMAIQAAMSLFQDLSERELINTINQFPGAGRRFEKLADNIYSDYGHHPVEIAATLQQARELNDHITLVYQPHQNSRQHELLREYKDSMLIADEIFWLPTYLSREDPDLTILSPKELIATLSNHEYAKAAEMNEELLKAIRSRAASGRLVLIMGAGTIDSWARQHLVSH